MELKLKKNGSSYNVKMSTEQGAGAGVLALWQDKNFEPNACISLNNWEAVDELIMALEMFKQSAPSVERDTK